MRYFILLSCIAFLLNACSAKEIREGINGTQDDIINAFKGSKESTADQ